MYFIICLHFSTQIVAIFKGLCYYLNGDFMNNDFIITKISRVIFVGSNEYTEKTTVFANNLIHNELILHLSGKSVVNFNGKELFCEKDVIRFLPKGDNIEYIVNREKSGECFDIFFDTDKPISKTAFTKKSKIVLQLPTCLKKCFRFG